MVKVHDNDCAPSYLSDEKAVKRFVRQMLKNHSFVGTYIEQRYVSDLACYKKIVKISNNEDIFIENLSVVNRRIENFFGNTKWVGISFPNTTGAPIGFNLWVDIDEEVFGTYQFQVKDVQFKEDQISLKLRVIEPHERHSSRESCLNRSSMSTSTTSSSSVNDAIDIERNDDLILTWRNFKQATIFIFLLMAALLTGGGQIIMFLLDYSLKLLREFSNIIKVSTPLFIACFDTISKMFGFICFLLASLWRDRHSRPNSQVLIPQKIQYQPAYLYANRYKALPYQKNSVTITELDD